MIQFLSDNIDQLDLALDQLAVSERNFDRFAIMLVDNVVELTLHRFVQDKASDNEMWGRFDKPKHDPKVIEKGLGQNFDNKAKAARKLGLFDEQMCESILNLHSFRNSSYHKGLRHEGILHSLAIFFFRCACVILESYEPGYWCYSSSDKISYRAKKYVGESSFLNSRDFYKSAYKRLGEVALSFDHNLIDDLSNDMTSTIDQTDQSIDFLSEGGPDNKTRDEVVIDSQAWPFAFSDKGKAFAKENDCRETTIGAIVNWLIDHYNWEFKADPIPGWLSRSDKLAKESCEHKALKRYCDFMRQTEEIRSKIEESALQLDGYIQQQIDYMRGK